MSLEEGRIRTVEDAGAEAVALLRKIDVERVVNAAPRPPVRERFVARLVDVVSYSLLVSVVLLAYHFVFRWGREEDPNKVTDPCIGNPDIDCYPFPPWGPVAIEWKLAALLVAVALGAVVWEVIQTRMFGATIGKRWHGFVVVSADGSGAASERQIAVRAAVLIAPGVIMVGLWAESLSYGLPGAAMGMAVLVTTLLGDHSNGFHDRIAGTEVVTRAVRGLAVDKVERRIAPGGSESG